MSWKPVDTETLNDVVTREGVVAGAPKNKFRGVWIAFASRIIAQVTGAVATIVLGLLVLQSYQDDSKQLPASAQTATRVTRAAVRGPSSKISIAVLPVANFSADARDQYVADGMTEAIIAGLTQNDALRVISRTSSMRYKGDAKSIPEIGQELDVDLIVESSIVKVGDRVHVTAQLIDAMKDEHLWAHRYQRTSTDVLRIQAELSAEIARDIGKSIRSQEAVRHSDRERNPIQPLPPTATLQTPVGRY